MHLVIAWETGVPDERAKEIDDVIGDILKPYASVRLLGTLHLLKIDAIADRARLVRALVDLGARYGDDVRITISPAMCGGTYDGWLPGELWEKVNERTHDP